MILHDSITRLRAPLVAGQYGNQTRDWANAASAEFLVHWSAQLAAQSVAEVVGDEARTAVRVKIFGYADLDLEATDRVVFEGDTYEVDGEILRSFRRGVPHHTRVFLKRIATVVA